MGSERKIGKCKKENFILCKPVIHKMRIKKGHLLSIVLIFSLGIAAHAAYADPCTISCAECTAGSVDQGASCDVCGVMKRVCQSNCVWGGWFCGYDTTCQDIGLRVYNGSEAVTIPVEPLGTLTSPLRIAKDGNTYGVAVVSTTHSDATSTRVQTSSGVKALRKVG
jgi:hypothetical protein